MASKMIQESEVASSLSEKVKEKIFIAATGAVVGAVVAFLILLATGTFTRLVVPENAILLVTGNCESGWKEAAWLHGKYLRFEAPTLTAAKPLQVKDRVRSQPSANYFLDYGKPGDRKSQQIKVVDTETPIAPDFYGLTPCQKRSF